MKVTKNLLIGLALGVLAGGILGWWLFNKNQAILAQLQAQEKLLEQQSQVLQTIQQGNWVALMSNVLQQVREELAQNPDHRLSDGTIARIASLNHALKPSRLVQGDSLSTYEVSQEKGQLLLALAVMRIDSTSFAKIKMRTPFVRADLRGADLNGTDLRGVDLRYADLREANLWGADLRDADLRGARLWGANLTSANLTKADLKEADFTWAIMNRAILREAEMNGADISHSQLQGADMRGVMMRVAHLNGAFLKEVNLDNIDLVASDLTKANLTEATLNKAYLRETNMNEAILVGAQLNEANMDRADLTGAVVKNKKWIEALRDWQVIGAEELQAAYKMVSDTADKPLFRLEKLENGSEF